MVDLKQLKADREAGTDGPWRYRPNSTDDWGTVCGPEQVGTIGTHICQARDPLVYRSEQLAEHRAAGTDPWEANARRIARLPELEEAYIEAVNCLLLFMAEHDMNADGDTESPAYQRTNKLLKS